MNRTFEAFAVLLVSLAGGMLAVMWTPASPHVPQLRSASFQQAARNVAACPGSARSHVLVSYEEGCGKDKTTGEVYGCGLGLGESQANDPAAAGTKLAPVPFDMLAQILREMRELGSWESIENWTRSFPEMAEKVRSLGSQIPLAPAPDRTATEADYAAAELAAALPHGNLKVGERMMQATSEFSRALVRPGQLDNVMRELNSLSHRGTQQSRHWLTVAGLQQPWDAAGEQIAAEDRLAHSSPSISPEDFQRWFENFPPPVTQPGSLVDPRNDDGPPPVESRRILLATAEALESVSAWLHQAAEHIAQKAEQDVAKLHTTKERGESQR